MRRIARLFGVGLFKTVAFLAGLAVIVVLWVYNPDTLVDAADANLRAIKFVASLLPQGYGSRTEAALRLFGADRAFIFVEVVSIIKLILLGIGRCFRRN